MKSLIILGRQPALGRAELESLFGPKAITLYGREAVLVDKDVDDIPFSRLGGSIKLARVLTELQTTQWDTIEAHITERIPNFLQDVAEGKLKFGLSVYGMRVNPKHLYATGLRLKKVIRATGRSVRVIPNKSQALNSAQVIHNQLTSQTGYELVCVANGNRTMLVKTYAEQDIDAYAKRDQNRPFRDAKIGMLPPKLAQLIVNLAVSSRDPSKEEVHVLDPFCGTGVVLQEALLMGCYAMGSDLNPRMVEYTTKNLHWLYEKIGYPGPGLLLNLDVADATNQTWISPFDTVACETFLGKPLSSLPPRHVLDIIMRECDELHEKFLHNLNRQQNVLDARSQDRPFRICLAVPAWKTRNGFLHLKMLDRIEKIGYNRVKFVHAPNEDLIYHREDQVVARELVVLEKQ